MCLLYGWRGGVMSIGNVSQELWSGDDSFFIVLLPPRLPRSRTGGTCHKGLLYPIPTSQSQG